LVKEQIALSQQMQEMQRRVIELRATLDDREAGLAMDSQSVVDAIDHLDSILVAEAKEVHRAFDDLCECCTGSKLPHGPAWQRLADAIAALRKQIELAVKRLEEGPPSAAAAGTGPNEG
jgi:hypothetical protein